MRDASVPRLGPVHAAALFLAALTSACYVAVVQGRDAEHIVMLLGYPVASIMASSIGLVDASVSTAIYVAGLTAYLWRGGGDPWVLALYPMLVAASSRRARDTVVSASAALGLWLVYAGRPVLGAGIVVAATGLSHMLSRSTAKGLSSAAALFLAASMASRAALVPVVLLYTLYLYVEERGRTYRPYVDRGLVVAGFAAQFASMLAFLLNAPLDAAWMIIASASYFLAAGLMIPRPSS